MSVLTSDIVVPAGDMTTMSATTAAYPSRLERRLSIGDEYRNNVHNYYHRIGSTVMSEGSSEFRSNADKQANEVITSSPRGSKVRDVTVTPQALEWTLELDGATKHAPRERRLSHTIHHVHHEPLPQQRVRRFSERSNMENQQENDNIDVSNNM